VLPPAVACVDLPALPLQLLLKRQPELLGHPVCVVDEDKPLGKVLWVNEKARRAGILSGMRYAAALSLTSDLRAGVVDADELQAGIERVIDRLLDFSPDVEDVPSGLKKQSSPKREKHRWVQAFEQEPGVFWVNVGGLEALFPDLAAWSRGVRDHLERAGFFSTVVVGYTRFGTYAVAKARPGYGVYSSPDDELRAARSVPLDRLRFDPKDRDVLAKLGVRTVGELCALPPGGLRRRFGPAVHRLYRMGVGELDAPLRPVRRQPPPRAEVNLDYAATDTTRVLFFIKRHLHPLLAELAERDQALVELELRMELDSTWVEGKRAQPAPITTVLTPASPTLDEKQVLDLVRLKLEGLQSSGGRLAVTKIELEVRGVRAALEQLRAFAEQALGARRDLDLRAADRALARLRAQYGDAAIGRLAVTPGHLPEARQGFEPIAGCRAPRVSERAPDVQLVRRVLARPHPLPHRPRQEPDGWMLRGLAHGPVMRVSGPFVVSGGWWRREVHREYHYAETQKGAALWVYYDKRRRTWFLHGVVE
jgi:protein ImuB